MGTVTSSKTFDLGRLVITPHAAGVVRRADIYLGLLRHACGDWGEVCAADAAENELSITEGFRLRSAYTDRNGVEFWVITEWDRSVTTVSLPEY